MRAPFDQASGAWSTSTPQDSAGIAAWQLANAWSVAEHLGATNPFYAGRLGALPAERTAEAFRTLSVTTKQEVVDDCTASPPYGSRTTAAAHDVRQVVETSGTSGRGREVHVLDAADLAAIERTEAVGFWWAGVRPGTPVLLTLPVGVTAAGLWYLGGLRLLGANVLAVGSYPTERKVDVLRRYAAEVVIGTPSYVQRLAAACEDEGIDPRTVGVRSLLVAGERYSAAWVREVEDRWGATLYEQYGCTERAIAWTCPGGARRDDAAVALHVPAESGYVEVVDPATGRHVEGGETGELIVTPFGAGASPLLRYATGDRVEWVPPGACACGRPVGGIRAGRVERYDNMLKVRGMNVWPEALDAAIFGVADVTDYRGVVRLGDDGRETIVVTLECPPPRAGSVATEVVASVRRAVGVRVEVEVVPIGTLLGQVPEGFVKIARWRDERPSARDEEQRR